MKTIVNDDSYTPLSVKLQGYWTKSFADLPPELKELVQRTYGATGTDGWDDLNEAGRRMVAALEDYARDPNHEPVLYFELTNFQSELNKWIEKAQKDSRDSVIVALRDVADRIESILAVDRARVGTEIQELREHKSVAQGASAALAIAAANLSDPDIDPADLPDELDCAMQAFRAVNNGYGDRLDTFRNRLLAWVAEHRADLGAEARGRIATVANLDKAPGRKSSAQK